MMYNHDRHHHRDDACPAAVHDPAALFGDAGDPAQLCPRRARRWARPAGRPSAGSTCRRPCRASRRASLLVFILAVGYYITPALVGGADGQLISNLIAFHMDKSNWSLAAALRRCCWSAILLLYWLYDRLVGIDRLKLG